MAKEKVLEVENLSISFRTPNGLVRAVRDVSFDLYKGETLAIVGESGSGKSVTNRAIMGILARNAIIDDGKIEYQNQDLTKLSEANFHKIRGNKIGMIFQDPLSSLNPIMRIGYQITEAMLVNGNRVKNRYLDLFHNEYYDYLNKLTAIKFAKAEIKNKIFEINIDKELTKVEKKEKIALVKKHDKELIATYKQELPGLKAKYAEAKAKAKKEIKKEVAEVNAEKKAKFNELKTQLAEKNELFNKVKENANVPQLKLENSGKLKDLKAAFDLKVKSLEESYTKQFNSLTADFDKNVADLLGQYEAKFPEEKGTFNDKKNALKEAYLQEVKNLKTELKVNTLNEKESYKLESKKAKDEMYPASYLEVQSQIKAIKEDKRNNSEAFRRRFKVTKKEARERAIQIMHEVGIPEPEKRFKQYPFQFSGGMRQRIVIAIALTANPELLICDEPTTALDVTIQGQILGLINNIKKERDLSVIFITHDLGVVANMADRVAVMYAGKIVEYGEAEEVFYDPKHPYTWALLSSIPDLETTGKLLAIPGTPPDMLFPPKGDAFADRNTYALKIDYLEQPPYFKVSETHYAATWLLHPDAPKIEAPAIITERRERYQKVIADMKQTKSDSKGVK